MTVPDRTFDVDVRPEAEPALDAEATEIEVDGSFALHLRAGESPARVHCRLDETLGRVAAVERANYYVEPGGERPVEVVVEDVAERVTGTVELAVGYGAESIELAVTVEPDSRPSVDGTLAEPRREEPEPASIDRFAAVTGVRPATLGVAALGLLALAIATATAAAVGGTVAYVGLLVVVAGVAIAAALLLS